MPKEGSQSPIALVKLKLLLGFNGRVSGMLSAIYKRLSIVVAELSWLWVVVCCMPLHICDAGKKEK